MPRNLDNDEQDFLAGVTLRPVQLVQASGLRARGLALGNGPSALEVVVASSQGQPELDTLRAAWKARRGGRAAPVILVVLYGDKTALCGPSGEEPTTSLNLDPGQVDRLCREALGQPDRHAALRSLRDSLQAVASPLGGVRNEGYLATHELRTGARMRNDWASARDKAKKVLASRGEELLRGLGFDVQPCDRVTSILRAGARRVAVAVLLTRDEAPEIQVDRFVNQSPISYAFSVADRENVPYVVIQHGSKVRVYPTDVGAGVGRRGRVETYVECHTSLLSDEDAAYLWLLCSADALARGGTLEQLLEASSRYSGELATRLRDRIYESVVPRLAGGIIEARQLANPTAQDLAETYEMTLVVLFRLLFIAYAEDKDLLPYDGNELYRRRSLKTKASEMLDLARAGTAHDASSSLWSEIRGLFGSSRFCVGDFGWICVISEPWQCHGQHLQS
jgi:hypothetical protein